MPENKQTVSVLMPCYQSETWISEAIQSVLGQTYPHFELIILDDFSTDRSFEICQSFARQDARIRLLRHAQNLGITPTYNDLLLAAENDWVFMLDGDDRMLPDRIERQLAFLQKHPHLILTGAHCYFINAKGERIGEAHNPFDSEAEIRKALQTDSPIWLYSPTAVYSRKTAINVGGYRNLSPGHDVDLNIRLARQGGVLCQPEFLGEYRIHGKSQTANKQSLALQQFRYFSACMRAYRLGNPEPTFAEFAAGEDALPFFQKLGLKAQARSAVLYKKAIIAYGNNNRAQAFILGILSAGAFPPFFYNKLKNRKLNLSGEKKQ